MKIITYVIRVLLVFLFVWSGIEKLFLPYNPSEFKADSGAARPEFFEFYDFLHGTGYLFFVGSCQLLCGGLLIFKRTYLLGAVMLFPLLLCLLMTHVFISRYTSFLLFDSLVMAFVIFLIGQNYGELKKVFLRKPDTLT